MANLKQSKKRVRVNEEARQLNAAFKSDMRTAIKRVEKLAQSNDQNAGEALDGAIKKIDKAVKRGAIHENNGNRKKSRLTKLVQNA
ncbi:30S ribosomal protein S20 [Salimicrobium jeotgali]|uniref:Small ribosomal subunit protein bS20 n=2 Tax=Salimicrobium TaxID=351195 RepID=K2GD97_9BACI|nr:MULTISPECIES: 30S ribosomal protein S20 [Salimicrobium]AKG04268.1 30S ribosomal protein S20 [Salimicrobium jeotgali]EKE32237.1 30S ribosomal protein S20 [Salimicrobium jeotgali]MBM7695848.1 small subunit ribosomal protein S20 [Salimicrobium jeotgali]PBB06839.1 30S ribosomal protein S20 [Salimicrobium humidisoli]